LKRDGDLAVYDAAARSNGLRHNIDPDSVRWLPPKPEEWQEPMQGLNRPATLRVDSLLVGICLTQVTPTCSMRAWWKSTSGISPSLR
jgi:hypothetical protein